MPKVYFVSKNLSKWEIAQWCFDGSPLSLLHINENLTEILETDLEALVRQKALAAFERIRAPLLVEHGSLALEYLQGLPGPLIEPVWRKLEQRMCALVPAGESRSIEIESAVCYCDGRGFKVFRTAMRGSLALSPAGVGGFHWDPIFIPSGHTQTFAELSFDEKQALAPNAQSLRKARAFIESQL